jgi:hypothetical protein
MASNNFKQILDPNWNKLVYNSEEKRESERIRALSRILLEDPINNALILSNLVDGPYYDKVFNYSFQSKVPQKPLAQTSKEQDEKKRLDIYNKNWQVAGKDGWKMHDITRKGSVETFSFDPPKGAFPDYDNIQNARIMYSIKTKSASKGTERIIMVPHIFFRKYGAYTGGKKHNQRRRKTSLKKSVKQVKRKSNRKRKTNRRKSSLRKK